MWLAGGGCPPKVYPRVGGGNLQYHPPLCRPDGLSPRGRGKLPGQAEEGLEERSIPAWAGET